MNELYREIVTAFSLLFGLFVFLYILLPFIVSLIVDEIEKYIWKKYHKDWNILGDGRLMTREGNEFIQYLKEHNICINDIVGNPHYDKEGVIDLNTLKNDIENGFFKMKQE